MFRPFYPFIILVCLVACSDDPKPKRCFKVKATAYNGVPEQTRPGSSGVIAAWGDQLFDSIPSIAVSRDLLDSGLTRGSIVYVSGFDTPFVVNDKMNKRHRKRIDIYMGKDNRKARNFGIRKVELCFEIPGDTIKSS